IALETIRSRTRVCSRVRACTCSRIRTACSTGTCLLIHLCEELLCTLHQFFLSSLNLSNISISCCLRSRFCKYIFQCLDICFYCCLITCIQLVAHIFESFLCLEYHCV